MLKTQYHGPGLALALTSLLMITACESASDPNHSDPMGTSDPGPRIEWQDPLKIASGPAHVGPWRMNESEFHYVDDPTVAVGSQGSIAVAWANNEIRDVMLVRLDSGGNASSDPVNVSSSPDVFSWLPRVAFGDSEEIIHVLWQEILFTGGSHGGEILYARSEDGGRTFSEPLNLSNTDDGAGKGRLTRERWHNGSLDLHYGHDGHLYAAWTAYEGPLHVSRSLDGGESFSEPLHVAGDSRIPARAPSLSLDTNGRLLVAWTVGDDPDANIHIARQSESDWSFEDPATIHAGAGHADAPKIRADASGQIHLVYGHAADGPAGFPQVVYAIAESNSVEFSSPRPLVSEDSSLSGGSGFPHMAIEDELIVVAWEHAPPAGRTMRGLGLAFSHDSEHFTAAHIIPDSDRHEHGVSGGRQGLLMDKLDLGPDGLIVAVHSTFRENESSAIWLFRGRIDP